MRGACVSARCSPVERIRVSMVRAWLAGRANAYSRIMHSGRRAGRAPAVRFQRIELYWEARRGPWMEGPSVSLSRVPRARVPSRVPPRYTAHHVLPRVTRTCMHTRRDDSRLARAELSRTEEEAGFVSRCRRFRAWLRSFIFAFIFFTPFFPRPSISLSTTNIPMEKSLAKEGGKRDLSSLWDDLSERYNLNMLRN